MHTNIKSDGLQWIVIEEPGGVAIPFATEREAMLHAFADPHGRLDSPVRVNAEANELWRPGDSGKK